jgi:hypothetical protein
MTDFGSTTVVKPQARTAQREQKSQERTLSTAETAECTCPDFCERDHETD